MDTCFKCKNPHSHFRKKDAAEQGWREMFPQPRTGVSCAVLLAVIVACASLSLDLGNSVIAKLIKLGGKF